MLLILKSVCDIFGINRQKLNDFPFYCNHFTFVLCCELFCYLISGTCLGYKLVDRVAWG
jgi:uncharacterized membrane protein YjjP (DUF1212 family)